MKKTISAVLMILALTLLAGNVDTSWAGPGSNPSQFPYSIFGTDDLMYMGSNTGTQSGFPCALAANGDNTIPSWFGTGLLPVAIEPSRIIYCVSIYPNDPSEVVNTAEYLSSSQKNHIYVRVDDGPCSILISTDSMNPAPASLFSWDDHIPGLTTGTANPMMGIAMVKLQDSAIADSAGSDYAAVAGALSSAGFVLNNKGFWVNQCYGGPMIFSIEP